MLDLWMHGLLTTDRVPQRWGRVKIFQKKAHQRLKSRNSEMKRDIGPTDKMVIGQNCTFLSKAAYWDLASQCFQHKIGVLLVPRFEGTKSFAPSPKKKHFGPKTADWKTMQMRCQGGFLIGGYQNLCSLPKKLGCVTQKTAILTQNMHFWLFWGEYRQCRLIWCPFGWSVVCFGALAAVTIECLPTL